MAATYDAIAKDYQQCKEQPWRLHIEHFGLFDLLGDLKGKTVLDLACGEGHYSRKLMRAGAAGVLGVDVSPRMIELAQAEEAREPLGARYLVEDVARLKLPEKFDLVLASYLFNYARSAEELRALAEPAFQALKPGGRLIGVNNNQEQPPETFGDSRKYGFIKSASGPLREGTPITYIIYQNGNSFQFDNYYLSTPTCDQVLRQAGFREVVWHAPRVSPAGLQEFGPEYWREFLANPPVILIECRT